MNRAAPDGTFEIVPTELSGTLTVGSLVPRTLLDADVWIESSDAGRAREEATVSATSSPESWSNVDFLETTRGVLVSLLSSDEAVPTPTHRTQPASQKRAFFHALQNWEGVVLEIKSDSFVARVSDTQNESPDEEAEFFVDDVSDWDKPLLAPGAVFYWSLGRTVDPSGAVSRTSLIRFRRLPAWSLQELRRADERARQLAERLGNGNDAGHASSA